jgi:oligogalacturonide lyase
MATLRTFPMEMRTFSDPQTGTKITQLTRHHAHSHHLYFTNSGLWDQGRRLLIASHRGDCENLFSIELATGALRQLTDSGPQDRPRLQGTFVNPCRDEAYFVHGGALQAVDLRGGGLRELYRQPDGYNARSFSCTADGRLICMAVCEDLSGRIRMDLGHGYVGFAEYSAARPHCRIVAIPTDGGEARVLFEEQFWLNHVNTSPGLANVLTFCHEGPWKQVDQRMWTLDVATGQVQPLRPQKPAETIGHEYWFADGRHVGYHGTDVDGVHLFGVIAHDGSGCREWPFPHGSFHFHSIDERLIVGDGHRETPHLLLWRLTDGAYEGPRVLLTHRGSWHVQFLHVHPRMFADADGRVRIVYTADPQGYGNVYVAEVGDFDALPPLPPS